MLYDGSNIWITDFDAATLIKLNSDGSVAQTLPSIEGPTFPLFDGTNIWVPNAITSKVIVVRVKDALGNSLPTAFLLAELSNNGLSNPVAIAFDGERIGIINQGNHSISLWKAADLTPLGNFPTGANTSPARVCSDGLNFWIVLGISHKLARF